MKKLIFVFGAGTGIGQSIFESLKNHGDKNVSVFGFSRRGSFYEGKLLENENHRFDLTNTEHFSIFETSFYHLLAEETKDTIELILYFAQGDGLFKPLENITKPELLGHFDLNLFSSMSILKIMTPAIKKMNQSTVVFLSSTASKIGFSNSSGYCASKHAVSGLAKALREEWKQYNVKVVNAYLGAIATSIWDSRTEFEKNDMISVSDAGEFLANISYLPQSLYLDEVYITPKKGVL